MLDGRRNVSEDEYKRMDPGIRLFIQICVALLVLMVAVVFIWTFFEIGRAIESDRIDERQQESQERSDLRRYETLDELCSLIMSKRETVEAHEGVLILLEDVFVNVPDGGQATYNEYNDILFDLDTAKVDYNSLAASYNRLMEESNWRFADENSLPSGASFPLPRRFELYPL